MPRLMSLCGLMLLAAMFGCRRAADVPAVDESPVLSVTLPHGEVRAVVAADSAESVAASADDFPLDVPRPDGGRMLLYSKSDSGLMASFVSSQSVDAVVQQLSSQLTEQGWTLDQSQQADGAHVLSADKERRRLVASIDTDQLNTRVALTVKPAAP